MFPAMMKPEAAPVTGGSNMQAVIDALEQARAALDQVEAAATQGRRDKAKLPAEVESPAEELSQDEEQE